MYIVVSPDPNPRGGGQLPNPNECNSTLTSATRGETLILHVFYMFVPVYPSVSLYPPRDHNENKIYPDLYYAIPAIVSLIVELLRPVWFYFL